jgi:hypothetical protein
MHVLVAPDVERAVHLTALRLEVRFGHPALDRILN